MVLQYFHKKENKDQIIAKKIYSSIISLLQELFNNKNFDIKRDFNSSFELMSLILFMIFYLSKLKSENKAINQHLMDLYIADLDKTLRELGIGDMNIGKYVKSYVKKIYYRISKLEIIFKNNGYDDFEKYFKKINIQKKPNNDNSLAKFLFNFINKSLKKGQKEDMPYIALLNLNN